MLGVKGAVSWLKQLKSVVITSKNNVKITVSAELLEDVIQLIEYLDKTRDMKDRRLAEQREEMHELIRKI